MKYELTEETIEISGHILHRIKYLEIDKLGGWIESEKNLDQDGEAYIFDDAKVYGNAIIYDNAIVCGNAEVSDTAQVYCNAKVFDDAKIRDNAEVYNDAVVYGDAEIYDKAYIYGDAKVYGKAIICGEAEINGDAQICGETNINSNVNIYGSVWHVPPLQIQGTKYFFYVSSKDSITVGCLTKTINEWLSSYKAEFDKHHFTKEQQTEYILYFNLAARLYEWNISLPIN